jgi:hypothetical protein
MKTKQSLIISKKCLLNSSYLLVSFIVLVTSAVSACPILLRRGVLDWQLVVVRAPFRSSNKTIAQDFM